MNQPQHRYSPDEIERRGTEFCASRIRSLVETGNLGRFLCIDVASGDYVVADQRYDAAKPLLDKNPDAQIWCLRVGHIAAARFGFGDTREGVGGVGPAECGVSICRGRELRCSENVESDNRLSECGFGLRCDSLHRRAAEFLQAFAAFAPGGGVDH